MIPQLLVFNLALLQPPGLLVQSRLSASRVPHLQAAQTPPEFKKKPKQQQQKKAKAGGPAVQPKKKKVASRYSTSVSLPITDFSQRAEATKREPELQQYWQEQRTYERLVEDGTGEKFVLHDGPPYANGDLHIGHALNKILKDFINRYQLLEGKRAAFVPGWDCHGLPIELKVLQSMKSKERASMTPLELRKKAAGFAQETMAKQRASFQRYGVWGFWDEPYLTLQPAYEAAQIGVFGKMVLNGHIFRGRKPVHWSPSSRTALAEAELEYPEGHVSKSIYAAFAVTEPSAALAPQLADGTEVRVAIWTTTPWTIPANLAVAVNGNLDYAVVGHPALAYRLIVAEALVGSLRQRLSAVPEGEELQVYATLKGEALAGTKYRHPMIERESEVVVGGAYITTESGTGLVHTAPGHGQDDYVTGLKYGLCSAGAPPLSPVDDAGKFTAEAGEALQGMDVLGEGNTACISALEAAGSLLLAEDYPHKYPYDWRTKKPTIFRATAQWFASVDGFRDEALKAIDEVTWIPEVGRNRITAMTQSRSDWCISRQRAWGVPIPVFYHVDTNEPLLTAESITHVQGLVAQHGSDVWWERDEAALLPESHAAEAHLWRKGTDTMDVWFDSGSSWAAVASARPQLRYPADMYLEGSDQHRGWFQSSLLTSVAANGRAPYNTVLTHGFVLDEKGYKMSKSLGNVVDPKQIIEGGSNKKLQPAFGADVLRLWVASSNYAQDICIGDSVIKQTADAYRKLRNTARYMLGNLHDYDPKQHAVPYSELPELDRYMLGRLAEVLAEARQLYASHQFSRVYSLLQQFGTSDLSNFYLDAAKDRLYISAADEPRRRSCQTVLAALIEGFAVCLAPLLPHLAEDIWQFVPYERAHASVFEAGWEGVARHDEPRSDADTQLWAQVRELRVEVNRAFEVARSASLIGATLEAKLLLHVDDPALAAALQKWGAPGGNGVDELRFLFLASQVELLGSADEVQAQAAHSLNVDGYHIGVVSAEGTKCERCWSYCHSVADGGAYPGACSRCAASLGVMGFVVPEPEPEEPEAEPEAAVAAAAAAAAPATAAAAEAAAEAAPPKKTPSSKEKKSSATRPPISLSEQQKDFEARRMMPGNKLATPPKAAKLAKKAAAKPAAAGVQSWYDNGVRLTP